MIHRKGFYSRLRGLLSAACFSTTFLQHHPHTHIAYRIIRASLPDRYNQLVRMNDHNQRIVTITQHQCRALNLLVRTSENSDDSAHDDQQ